MQSTTRQRIGSEMPYRDDPVSMEIRSNAPCASTPAAVSVATPLSHTLCCLMPPTLRRVHLLRLV